MAREYEPAIAKLGFLREDEPRFPIQLREDEPGWIGEDPSCDVDEPKERDFSYPVKVSEGLLDGRCSMRVTASVAGPDLKVDGDRTSLPQVDSDDFATYHCPTGCPGRTSPSAVGGLAMEEHRGGREVPLKMAALRVGAGVIGAKNEFWEREIFTRPPSHRKDCWVDAFLDEGWLVRSHGGPRVRRFHPVHRGVPVELTMLQGPRVNIGFNEQGQRSVVHDLWTIEPQDLFVPKARWTGSTLFQLRGPVKPALGGKFVEGAGQPLSRGYHREAASSSGVELSPPWTPDESGGPEGVAGRGLIGRAGERVIEKGRIVTNQIPGLKSDGPKQSLDLHDEDPLSDESEWERISRSSILD